MQKYRDHTSFFMHWHLPGHQEDVWTRGRPLGIACMKFVTQNCLKALSNKRKSIFKSWHSCAVLTWVLIWQYLKWALICLSDITRAGIDTCVNFFVCENVARIKTLWRRYAVRKFNAVTILFGENQCKKWYFKVLAVLSAGFWLESGTICKNNDFTCLFHCINTCRPLGKCWCFLMLGYHVLYLIFVTYDISQL